MIEILSMLASTLGLVSAIVAGGYFATRNVRPERQERRS